jgi:nitrate/nitrite-specific signal transduction histidine kinase
MPKEESLSNVLKRARASRVDVQIPVEQGTLSIRISDNRIGFVLPRTTETARGAVKTA